MIADALHYIFEISESLFLHKKIPSNEVIGDFLSSSFFNIEDFGEAFLVTPSNILSMKD